MKWGKNDNSTLRRKVSLRRVMLSRMTTPPVIVETHGGVGAVFDACYSTLTTGVVFEKDTEKAALLALHRPTWAVYEADCVAAMAAGAGAHLGANVLDVDPYGDPWPAIGAFFGSERPRSQQLYVVVNDGLRKKVQLGGAWHVATLEKIVARYGNQIYQAYLEVCREMMVEQAARAGYTLAAWAGYYCGHNNAMTHYLAVLER